MSAFAGSDLELVLRAGGIEAMVLSGIATSGVVLSTLRHAADLDFELPCSPTPADGDDEVYRVLTEKVFPRQAQVTTVAQWRDASPRPSACGPPPVSSGGSASRSMAG